MAQIFISYSRSDRELLEEFTRAVLPMTARLKLTVWWDQELQAGQKWDARIRTAIDASDIFILLVTNSFLMPDGYIMKVELPAINSAKTARGVLILPVVGKPSHWQDYFGEIQAVPQTRQGRLVPIISWGDAAEGCHESSVQLKKPIIDFLNKMPVRPDPGPGPAMAPTPVGFEIIGKRPTDIEQGDPVVRGHHGDILDNLEEVAPFLDRLSNVDQKLARTLKSYSTEINRPFPEISIDRVWSLGGRLCDRIDVAVAPGSEIRENFNERASGDLIGELLSLRRSHSALIMSTQEGRDLVGKVSAHRSASSLLSIREDGAHRVLAPMLKQKGLLEPSTRDFVSLIAAPLQEGTENIDQIEAGLRTAIHGIVAFFEALDPLLGLGSKTRASELAVRQQFADDPNITTILAAFSYIDKNSSVISRFSESEPDLRRYVQRTIEVLSGAKHEILRDPDETADADAVDIAKNAILNCSEIPDNLCKLIFSIDLSSIQKLGNISSISKLVYLNSLDISNTSVSDIASLSNLDNLMLINAWKTNIVDISSFSKMPNLQEVFIWGTNVSDIGPLRDLNHLRALDISYTKVSNLLPIAGSKSLEYLDISRTNVKLAKIIESFENLEVLDASRLLETIDWPYVWPKKLKQLNLYNSLWPKNWPLPEVEWRIDPDGAVHLGTGALPLPFRWWLDSLEFDRPPSGSG